MSVNPETINVFRLTIGDGGDPETFEAPCLLKSRGLSRSKNLRDDEVMACPPADPYAPQTTGSWTERTETTKTAEISGEGKLSKDHHAVWETWFETHNLLRNCRIHLVSRDTAPGPATVRGYYAGAFQLARYDLQSEDEAGLVMVTLTLSSSGSVLWTAEPAS